MSARERWVAVAFNENKLMVRENTLENSAYLCFHDPLCLNIFLGKKVFLFLLFSFFRIRWTP